MNTASRSALAGFLALSACHAGSAIPQATLQQLERARRQRTQLTLEELERGRTLYVERCGGCHNLALPSAIPTARWGAVIASMGPKAGLDAATAELILAYLESAPADREETKLD